MPGEFSIHHLPVEFQTAYAAGQAADVKEVAARLNLFVGAQEEKAGALLDAEEANAANMRSLMKTTKKEKPDPKDRVKAAKTVSGGEKIRVSAELEQAAGAMSKKTAGELSSAVLLALHGLINDSTGEQEILELVKRSVKKDDLVHEALEFLHENSRGKAKETLKSALDNHYKQNKKEIDYGLEIGQLAREMSKFGGGKPGNIRDEIAQFLREDLDTRILFNELRNTYGSYKNIKEKLHLMYDLIGKETHDPNIEHPYLLIVNTTIRKMQAIGQVYLVMKKKHDEAQHDAAGIESPAA